MAVDRALRDGSAPDRRPHVADSPACCENDGGFRNPALRRHGVKRDEERPAGAARHGNRGRDGGEVEDRRARGDDDERRHRHQTRDILAEASRAVDEEPFDRPVLAGGLDDLVDREVAEYANATIVEVDDATSRRLKRLIDKRVMVVMVVTYLVQTLDKGTMSYASIMGIQEDTHLVGQQVSRSVYNIPGFDPN